MMNRSALKSLLLLSVGIGLAIPLATAQAETDVKYSSGPCEGVDAGAYASWYSVTTFECGVPAVVYGRGCDGKYYRYRICPVIVSTDPTGTLTYTGICGGANWQCEIRYNDNHTPNWIGGRNGDGDYYVDMVMALTYPEEGEGGGHIE